MSELLIPARVSIVNAGNGSWSLHCPHVSKSVTNSRLTVTWSLNGAIWLKIDSGRPVITNRLTSFNQRSINGELVLRTVLNAFRYVFVYDEVTGDFSLAVQEVRPQDAGIWECQVTMYRRNGLVQRLSTIRELRVMGQGLPSQNDHFRVPVATFATPRAVPGKQVIIERDQNGHQKTQASARLKPWIAALFCPVLAAIFL